MAIQSETVELQVENDRIAGTLVSPGTKCRAFSSSTAGAAASNVTWPAPGISPDWDACA